MRALCRRIEAQRAVKSCSQQGEAEDVNRLETSLQLWVVHTEDNGFDLEKKGGRGSE